MIVFILLVTISIAVFTGCGVHKHDMVSDAGNDEVNELVALPFEQPLDFGFASGVGGWGTVLTLKPDGTFVGSYHDSEMGVTGEGYPNGTVYISEFSGKFDEFKKIDDYSYSIKLIELTVEDKGKEYIEDGIRYIVSEANGLDGKDFVFYIPDTPVEMLPEEPPLTKRLQKE